MVGSRRLSDDVIEISGGKQPSSNVYLIISKNMLVDLGNKENSEEITNELNKYTKLADIKTIVFTHLHYDHTGNPLLLKDAEFYASKEEIEFLKTYAKFADASIFKNIMLKGLKEKIEGLKVIKTPGHSNGSICLWKEDDKILFTGDTLFRTGAIGRTDLPTSRPEKMQSSLIKLLKYDYKEIAPGHNLEHGRLL